jgi:glycosyltransferase involved in cell wall biosynthesis
MRRADAPALSVVMAVRDGAPHLAQAIESILAQSCGDFELLIFDDGSSDGSPEIAHGYAKGDRRVSLYRGTQVGQTLWLREGIARARGEFVARMDGDDVAYPERFAKQLAYLRAHPECVAIGACVRVVDAEGRPIRTHRVPLEHAAIDAGLLRGGGTLLHPISVLRRRAVLAVGNYREQRLRAQDVDLFLRLAEIGLLANLPEVLLDLRRHPHTVSATQAREQRQHVNIAIQDALRRRGLTSAAQQPLPDVPARSLHDLWYEWARGALGDGHPATARHYARLLLRAAPWSPRSWNLALRAATGFSGRRLLAQLRGSADR